MSKIFVLVLSPALDYLIRTDDFRNGKVIRAQSTTLIPSGKGVNTARTIAALNADVHVIGLIGNDRQAHFSNLGSKRISTLWYAGDWVTRMNVTIVDTKGSLISHIRAQSEAVDRRKVKQIVADLFGRLKNGDVLVLSGSLPKGLPSDTYAGIIKRSNKAGVMTILDAEGEVLRLGMAEHPTIAKPNQAEFGTLFPNADARSSGQLASSLMKALGDTKGSIFLSLGSKGVAVVKAGEQTLWRGQVSIKGSQRLGEEIGSGDSMVGALAVGLQQGKSIEGMIRMGVACGAANLLHPIPGLVSKKDVQRLSAATQVVKSRIRRS